MLVRRIDLGVCRQQGVISCGYRDLRNLNFWRCGSEGRPNNPYRTEIYASAAKFLGQFEYNFSTTCTSSSNCCK